VFAPVLGKSESVSKADTYSSTPNHDWQAKTKALAPFRKSLKTISAAFFAFPCGGDTLAGAD
jgi:hypothetical protein